MARLVLVRCHSIEAKMNTPVFEPDSGLPDRLIGVIAMLGVESEGSVLGIGHAKVNREDLFRKCQRGLAGWFRDGWHVGALTRPSSMRSTMAPAA